MPEATTMDATPPAAAFQEISLDRISEARENPRQLYNVQKMAELEASIKRHGIITPLVVRPHGSGFQLAAGHRRFRVAKKLKLVTVPCRIRPMEDTEFLEVLTIENCQREDVHPLEEGDGFFRLIKVAKYTPEMIAEKIGKDPSYVYRRLALANLITPIKQAFLAGEGGFGISHAVPLARLKPADQQEAFKRCFEATEELVGGKFVEGPKRVISVGELGGWIRRHVYLDLASAPWDKSDARLPGGACTTCPKQTGSNAHLFDDFKPGDERCGDRACYAEKEKAFVKNELVRLGSKGKHILQVAGGWKAKMPAGVVDVTSFSVGGKKCDYQQKALVVAEGDHYSKYRIGMLLDVCARKDCPVHRPTSALDKRSLAQSNRRKQAEERRLEIAEAARIELLRVTVTRALDKLTPAQHRDIVLSALGARFEECSLSPGAANAIAALAEVELAEKDPDPAETLARKLKLRGDTLSQLVLALGTDLKPQPPWIKASKTLLDEIAAGLKIDPVAIANRVASQVKAAGKATKPAVAKKAAQQKKGGRK